ncbi:CatB-related O-acetyltransferase [Alteromonas sp. D210916BOD_24]|uniref:CatB-related O-acetyltransferase n=1 Tax=Alteromonas sp. D210916BOD_24 TaxID=3157618 RepID=UPI00399C50E4
MTVVTITKAHIERFKQLRFLAAPPHTQSEISKRDDSIGWIKLDSRLTFRSSIEIEPYAAIYQGVYQGSKGAGQSSGLCSIGAMSYSHSALPEKLCVGRYCSIGEGLKVLDSHHPIANVSTSHFTWRTQSPAVVSACADADMQMPKQPSFPINGYKPFPVIKNDVWIGQNVTLSMGVVIGNGAVVAANSVVTKSVPDFAIVGGNPAQVIKYRFTEEQIIELKSICWWDYLFTDFANLNFQCIDTFIRQWKEIAQNLSPYRPKPLVLPQDFLTTNTQP